MAVTLTFNILMVISVFIDAKTTALSSKKRQTPLMKPEKTSRQKYTPRAIKNTLTLTEYQC
jgi:hypothetical protein